MSSVPGGLNLRVDLGTDFESIRQRFAQLTTAQVRQAAARSLNRVGVTARQAVAPVIEKELNGALPLPMIRRAIQFRNARGERLFIDLRAVGGRRIAAKLFSPRQTRAGVTIRIGRRSVRIDKAFITPSGHVRVRGPTSRPEGGWRPQFFDQVELRNKRTGYRGKKEKNARPDYPIPMIVVPGVPRVFLQTTVVDTVQRTARERFPVLFARELEVRSRGLVKARS
jgi:hypothetical protein